MWNAIMEIQSEFINRKKNNNKNTDSETTSSLHSNVQKNAQPKVNGNSRPESSAKNETKPTHKFFDEPKKLPTNAASKRPSGQFAFDPAEIFLTSGFKTRPLVPHKEYKIIGSCHIQRINRLFVQFEQDTPEFKTLCHELFTVFF